MPTIRLEKATKWYTTEQKNKLFKGKSKRRELGIIDADLTIEQGEFVFVIGSSGAGKSTLLNLISGEEKPDSGMVFLDERDMQKLRRKSHNKIKLIFGHVFQESNLIRKMTVEDNLYLVAQIGRRRGERQADLQARISKALSLVGMLDKRTSYPGELSGGECRRIELARALINSPSILVLDELTSGLDDDNIWDILHLLQEINQKGITVIMATHAGKYVNIMRRRVITLVDGKIFGDVKNGKYGDVN